MTVPQYEQLICTDQTCDNKFTPSDSSLRLLEVENHHLRMMIAELLMKNRRLRWKLQEQQPLLAGDLCK